MVFVAFSAIILATFCAQNVQAEVLCNPFRGSCEGVFLELKRNVSSNRDCSDFCASVDNCTWFSFKADEHLCFAMESCNEQDTDDLGYFSAPVFIGSDCKCGVHGLCHHGYLVEYENETSPRSCLHQCHMDVTEGCQWVTFNVVTHSCFLFKNCSYGFNASHPYSISGHKECSMGSVPGEAEMEELISRMNFLKNPEDTTITTELSYDYDYGSVGHSRKKREVDYDDQDQQDDGTEYDSAAEYSSYNQATTDQGPTTNVTEGQLENEPEVEQTESDTTSDPPSVTTTLVTDPDNGQASTIVETNPTESEQSTGSYEQTTSTRGVAEYIHQDNTVAESVLYRILFRKK